MIGTIRKKLYKLRGSNRFERFEELESRQFRPLNELRQEQFALLSALLRHAYATVPFYRSSFEAVGATPEDIRTFADFAKLPVLSRQDLECHGQELLSSAVPAHERILNSSGGTTGNPVQFYQDKGVHTEMEANLLLFLSFAGWAPADMLVSVWGNPRDCLSGRIPGGLRPWLSGKLLLNAYHYGRNDLAAWLRAVKRYKRVFLYGYASVIADFAEYAGQAGDAPNNIAGVITTAEKLYPEQRQIIRDSFNCKVFDQYGSREVPGVACECDKGGMHLITHSAYAEFLPLEDATSASEEEPKRIVLTSLHNRAMPLLRYELGDFGSPVDGICPCGRGYPLMRMDIGRIGGSLVLPDGSRLYSSMFVRQLFGLRGVSVFQFRQTAIDRVQLFVVRGSSFDADSAQKLNQLEEDFPRKICPGLNLSLHYVDEVPRTAGGKHRQVVCEVKP